MKTPQEIIEDYTFVKDGLITVDVAIKCMELYAEQQVKNHDLSHHVIESQILSTKSINMYYIRNEGYLGNALMWWSEGNNGYTCDIRNAGKYTKEEAENICKRPEDTAYECEYIDSLLHAQKLIVDCQYVDESKRLWKP